VFVAERPESSGWRYRLLETVRQYAHERLQSAADAAHVCARYVEYYRTLAEAMEPRINTADRQARLDVLEDEHGNLLGAIERATHAGQHSEAARLATALFWFWFHRGHWREGRAFLGAVIEQEIAPSRVRARCSVTAHWRGAKVRTQQPGCVSRNASP
jgi:predicted ATPase